MSAATNVVQSAAMARREEESEDGTVSMNFRLPKGIRATLLRYTSRPLGPNMTAIVVQALREWFARNPLPPEGSGGDPRLGQRGKR